MSELALFPVSISALTFSNSASRSEITLLNSSISFTFVSLTESSCSRTVASSVSFSSNNFFAASEVEEDAVGRAEVVEEEEDARVRGRGAVVELDGTTRLTPVPDPFEVEVAGTRVGTGRVVVEEVADKELPGRVEVEFPTVDGRVLAAVGAVEEGRGRRIEADVVPAVGRVEDFAVRIPFEVVEEARFVERGAVGGKPPLTAPRKG